MQQQYRLHRQWYYQHSLWFRIPSFLDQQSRDIRIDQNEDQDAEQEFDDGWVCLHRRIVRSQVWLNPGLLKIWLWCLTRASYKERWVPVQTGWRNTEVHLQPGQFIFGRKKAAERLNMRPSTVRYRMQKLKDMGNVDIRPESHWSIITINNWEIYQNIYAKNGQPIEVEFISNIYKANLTTVIQCNIRDITDRKNIERTLANYTEELEQRNQDLDAFAQTVAHDLKNPLTAMIGFASHLKRNIKDLPDQARDLAIKTILNNARSMNSIINALLLLASVLCMGLRSVPSKQSS